MNRFARAWLLLGACLAFRGAPAEEKALYEPGAQVKITGKYKELVGRELFLVDCPLPLLLQKDEFLQQLLRFRSHRDNVKATGIVVKRDTGLAVEVEQLDAAPGDLEVFTEEFEKLKGATGKEGSRKLLSLMRRTLTSYEGFREQALLELAHKVGRTSVQAASAGSNSPEAEARLIREVYELLGDRDFALESILDVEKRFPGKAAVRDFLEELAPAGTRGNGSATRGSRRWKASSPSTGSGSSPGRRT